MKGRIPKSSHLRLLEGNPSRRAIVPDIIIEGDLGPPPAWFQPQHVLKWEHVLRFSPRGMLTELDRQLVTSYCIAAVNYDAAAQHLATPEDLVVLSPNKQLPMQSPWLHTLNQADAQLARIIDKLGFSPQSRTRVKVPHGKKSGGTTFANLKKFQLEEKRPK